ncbi:MAG: response regulator, partial [Myxococcales bacterium]|nr:response regulator [Myxococcales bacterium]
VGQLTAGNAHNFNNLHMVILPNLELTPLVPPEERLSLVEDARQAAERAAELVRQLVVFAGKDAPAAYAVKDVAPLVERTVAICRGTFDRQTSVEARVASALPLVSMDAGQIEQALLNVCLNARDAMSDRAVRRLLVEVAALAARAPELGRRGVDADRAWVCIRVTDTGHGMDEATRRRLFEPFFTTKPPGKGTGLGLASVYAVMKAHGGWIDVDSTPNVGTTLSLFLPAAEQGSPAVGAPPEPRERAAGQHVLVVDDEPLVREVVARVLEDGGYRVSLAAGAGEALEVFERTPEGFALVLLDLSMPDGSGRDVCRAMKARRPRQPVVYFSGYPLDEASEADGVVEKPVGAEALLAAVDHVLGKG